MGTFHGAKAAGQGLEIDQERDEMSEENVCPTCGKPNGHSPFNCFGCEAKINTDPLRQIRQSHLAQLLVIAKAAKEYRAYRTGGQIKDPTKTLAKIVDELDAALSALAPDVLEER